MDLVTLDAETFWSTEHTLKKMSAVEYVMHPDTELQSMSAKVNKEPAVCVFGEDEIRRLVKDLRLEKRAVVGHNMSVFDSLILAWRLQQKPRMWLCTLAMARPVHGKTLRLGLGSLVEHYADELRAMGISPVKDNSALVQTRGKRLAEFTPDERRRMAAYNSDDTDQCYGIFQQLKRHFTADELWHIDCNIRMLVEAEFELDTGMLETALSVERSNKHRALLTLAKHLNARGNPIVQGEGWSKPELVADRVRSEMQSSAKFAALLESLGVDVPMKRSKTDPRKKIPAIAKTDEAMAELLDDPDDVVAAAAAARLSAKSTQLETRIGLFLNTYKWAGALPVPAHYCGADTTGRDSGFWYNMYNLPRVNPDKPKVGDALRRSIRAPKGKKVGVSDLSGIELRVNHTLWKVARSMNMWKAKADADLYRATASRYYEVEEPEVQKPQRQFAKVLELSCGFGIAGPKFKQTARIQGGLRLTDQEASDGVSGWRAMYPEISSYEDGGWGLCQEALAYIAAGQEVAIDPWGLCHTTKDAIVLPSGRLIRYPGLRQEWGTQYTEVDGELVEKRKQQWVYADGRHKAYLYGGKVDENIVQALARDIIFPNAIEFWKQAGLRPKHKVYDELCYLFPEQHAEEMLALLQSIMRTPPKWWPSLVLWSEGDIGDTYGEAK